MAILKRELWRKVVENSLRQDTDWWNLCYDTDSREFFVEHEWYHVNPNRLSDEPADSGQARESVESYLDHGSDKIEAFKTELLAEAGHA